MYLHTQNEFGWWDTGYGLDDILYMATLGFNMERYLLIFDRAKSRAPIYLSVIDFTDYDQDN